MEIPTDKPWKGQRQHTGYLLKQVIYIEPVGFEVRATDQVPTDAKHCSDEMKSESSSLTRQVVCITGINLNQIL